MFRKDNATIQGFTWIEERLGGVNDLEIVFRGLNDPNQAPPFSEPEADRLEELRLRRAVTLQGLPGQLPLNVAETGELAVLEAKDIAVQVARIGVSIEFLTELDNFERRLRREMADPKSPLHLVTDLASPLDILRKIHQVQNQNLGGFYRVPRNEDVAGAAGGEKVTLDDITGTWLRVPAQGAATLIAQYYLQYENGARPGENLTTQITQDRTQFRMQGRMLQESSVRQLAACQLIEKIAREEFPRLAATATTRGENGRAEGAVSTMAVSGKSYLIALSGWIVSEQFVQSLAMGLLCICGVIGLLFRSLRLGVVSLLPNIFPIVLPLSLFGFLGIPLTAPASFVGSIALGVIVDDTIHMFAAYMRARRAGRECEAAIADMFEHVGGPVTITTVVLFIGFGILALGDFVPNILLGVLATAMFAIGWVADLIFTPALLSLLERAPPPVPVQVPKISTATIGDQ